jgi:hypothetical protein
VRARGDSRAQITTRNPAKKDWKGRWQSNKNERGCNKCHNLERRRRTLHRSDNRAIVKLCADFLQQAPNTIFCDRIAAAAKKQKSATMKSYLLPAARLMQCSRTRMPFLGGERIPRLLCCCMQISKQKWLRDCCCGCWENERDGGRKRSPTAETNVFTTLQWLAHSLPNALAR